MTHWALWSKRVRACPDRIGIWKCWFLRRGKNRSTRREPWGENQEQTQLAYGIRSNPDRTTLVGGECSHHCATFASLHRLAARISLRSMIFYKCLGWAGFVTSAQSQEKERAHAGLTSDISIVSLAFDDETFSRLKFLHLPRLFFDSNIQLNQCWTLWFILLFLTDFSLKRYLY